MANPRQVPSFGPSVSLYVKPVEPCEDSMMLMSWAPLEAPGPLLLGCHQPWLNVTPQARKNCPQR